MSIKLPTGNAFADLSLLRLETAVADLNADLRAVAWLTGRDCQVELHSLDVGLSQPIGQVVVTAHWWKADNFGHGEGI